MRILVINPTVKERGHAYINHRGLNPFLGPKCMIPFIWYNTLRIYNGLAPVVIYTGQINLKTNNPVVLHCCTSVVLSS